MKATFLHVQSLGRLVHIDDLADPANVGSDNISIDDLEPVDDEHEDETNIDDIAENIQDSESEGDDDSPLGTF